MNLKKLVIISSLIFCLACGGQEDNTQTETDNSVESSGQTEKNDNQNKDADIKRDYGSDSNNLGSNEGNKPPKIEEITIEIINGNPREGFKAIVKAFDLEDDFIGFIYEWKYNDEYLIGETGDTLAWRDEFKRDGEITLEVIPYDNQAQGIWRSQRTFNIPNSPPVIESEPPDDIENGKFSYEVKANDPDGDNITINLNNSPEGMSFDPESNIVEWNINKADPGNYKIEIVVTDEIGANITQILDLSVTKEPKS